MTDLPPDAGRAAPDFEAIRSPAPAGPPPGKLIRTALRAAARVVAPGAAWPGSVPQQPG